jgi:hypothetical protein
MPRSPHTIPQGPIAVAKIAKCWPVMAGSSGFLVVSLMPDRNMGLEIVAIHPNPEGT